MNHFTELVITALRTDATRHEQGNYRDVGSEFNAMERYRSEHPDEPWDSTMGVAYTFGDSWVDQVAHGFEQNFYSGMTPEAWPKLARELSNNLETGTPVVNPVALYNFDLSSRTKRRSLIEILSTLISRVTSIVTSRR